MKLSAIRARWAFATTVAGILLLAALPAMAAGLGTWSPVPPPATPRATDHTATGLLDGKVLVVGGISAGEDSKGAITSAELYDPVAKRWTPAGSLGVPRQYHRATRLTDGRVLVTGGYFENKLVDAAEVFDPKTSTWKPAGAMGVARMAHTATLLSSGKVLVAGGLVFGPDRRFTFSLDAELFDPASGAWSPAEPMPIGRAEHTATELANGNVLLAGGQGAAGRIVPGLRDAVLYDAASGTWRAVPRLMADGRAGHSATRLSDGTVLLVGGSRQKEHGGGGRPLSSAELYDPVGDTFRRTSELGEARLAHTADLLGDGRVVVVGGVGQEDDQRGAHPVRSSEIYDPARQRWTAVASAPVAPSTAAAREMRVWLYGGYPTATLLSGDKCGTRCASVLVVGGDDPGRSAQLLAVPASAPPAAKARQGAGSSGSSSSSSTTVIAGAAFAAAVVIGGVLAFRRTAKTRAGSGR